MIRWIENNVHSCLWCLTSPSSQLLPIQTRLTFDHVINAAVDINFHTSGHRFSCSYYPAIYGMRKARPLYHQHHLLVSIERLTSVVAIGRATPLVRVCSLIVGVSWRNLSGQRRSLRPVCEVLPMNTRRLKIAMNVRGHCIKFHRCCRARGLGEGHIACLVWIRISVRRVYGICRMAVARCISCEWWRRGERGSIKFTVCL